MESDYLKASKNLSRIEKKLEKFEKNLELIKKYTKSQIYNPPCEPYEITRPLL